jgi:hypothetical protein
MRQDNASCHIFLQLLTITYWFTLYVLELVMSEGRPMIMQIVGLLIIDVLVKMILLDMLRRKYDGLQISNANFDKVINIIQGTLS